eukprot:scaffold1321_cov154-Skeletonema_menzelii.AAC.14
MVVDVAVVGVSTTKSDDAVVFLHRGSIRSLPSAIPIGHPSGNVIRTPVICTRVANEILG